MGIQGFYLQGNRRGAAMLAGYEPNAVTLYYAVARSVEGESSGGSRHRREVTLQAFEFNSDYNVPSPEREGDAEDESSCSG